MLKTINVNIAQLPWQYLRFVHPKLEKDVIGDVVFISKPGAGRGFEVEFVQDRAGYPVYQKDGVIALLRGAELLPEAKIKRLESPTVTSLDVVYRSIATLRVANTLCREDDSDFGYVLDFLKLPLEERVQFVLDKGTPQLLSGIVGALAKALDKELLKQQNKFYIQRLSEMLGNFRRRDFKENFELTDNWQEDLLHLQFYFVNR